MHLPFLLLTTTTITGLALGTPPSVSCDRLESFTPPLCDPHHLVSPTDSSHINLLLTKCMEKSGYKVAIFLTASITSHGSLEESTTTTTTNTTDEEKGGDDYGDAVDMANLTELVKNANNLTTSSSPVILVVGVQEHFQMSTWWSDSLCRVLTPDIEGKIKQAVSRSQDQQEFAHTLAHFAYNLCMSASEGEGTFTTKQIVLTAVWGIFIFLFISLLVAIAVILLRARHIALTEARSEANDNRKQGSSLPYPLARTSRLLDVNVASFTSTGHVLFGTTDILVVPPSDCSSMDNLLSE